MNNKINSTNAARFEVLTAVFLGRSALLTGKQFRRLEGAQRLHYKLDGRTKCSRTLSVLGMRDPEDEAFCSLLSAGNYHWTRRYIPEDFNLQQQRCFNCKSCWSKALNNRR
jgi:hypothetical protein